MQLNLIMDIREGQRSKKKEKKTKKLMSRIFHIVYILSARWTLFKRSLIVCPSQLDELFELNELCVLNERERGKEKMCMLYVL